MSQLPIYSGLSNTPLRVHTPPYTVSTASYKTSTTTFAGAYEPPPPLLAGTVHDYSSRRGVLNCDRSLAETKLRRASGPNSATYATPRYFF